ncbi:hypothetical protein K1T71_014332 [Dendrolimus kikuchii]|uniref:Uncharacterized protein n=1 Tax=Dendrolimus kikuchii TaxID=765133 RepID=A0ACC1CDQ3_9NEOP|nr:hypothetical protein K1T71_014332 [Dendrolimus kikuchii]
MVRNYKKTTNQHAWSSEAMKKAVQKVVSGEMGYKKASKALGVPQTTLERYVHRHRNNLSNIEITKKLGHYRTIFSQEQEEELVQYIKTMEARFHGLTSLELRRLAYEIAERNKMAHKFNADKCVAGVDWLKGFLKRHPDITYRKPEPTSAARAMGFNRVAVGKFYELLETVYDKHKITPQRIFNVDETGVSTVPKCYSKILASTGKRQVGTLTSAERGKLMTTIICFSAVGNYMPPMFIFPRKRMKPELLDGAPAGSWGECHESGWIQSHLFVLWLKRFIEWSQASKDEPVLLLLDGHATHVKTIEVIDIARENGVVLLCFPPHCTHRLQPLDVGFMKPLNTYYGNELKNWLRSHPGRVVSQYQTAGLFGKAFVAAATMTTAINSFRATGIWPVNKNIFTDADFAPAATTDNPNISEVAPHAPQILNIADAEHQLTGINVYEKQCTATSTGFQTPSSVLISTNPSNSEQMRTIPGLLRVSSPQPGCSWMTDTLNTSAFVTTPEQIMPLPKENRTKLKATKRRGKTAVITESPYKNELIALKEAKEKKGQNQCRRKVTKIDLVSTVQERTTKKPKEPKRKNTKCVNESKGIQKKKGKSNKENTTPDISGDEDAKCIYCGYL